MGDGMKPNPERENFAILPIASRQAHLIHFRVTSRLIPSLRVYTEFHPPVVEVSCVFVFDLASKHSVKRREILSVTYLSWLVLKGVKNICTIPRLTACA